MEVRWAEYSSDTSKENTKESDCQPHRPPVFGSPVWKNNYFIYVTFILTPEQGLNWRFCVLRLWLHRCQGMKWDFTNQGMCTTPGLQYDLLKYVKYWKTLKRSWRTCLVYFRVHLTVRSWDTYAKPNLYLLKSTWMFFCLKAGCP